MILNGGMVHAWKATRARMNFCDRSALPCITPWARDVESYLWYKVLMTDISQRQTCAGMTQSSTCLNARRPAHRTPAVAAAPEACSHNISAILHRHTNSYKVSKRSCDFMQDCSVGCDSPTSTRGFRLRSWRMSFPKSRCPKS